MTRGPIGGTLIEYDAPRNAFTPYTDRNSVNFEQLKVNVAQYGLGNVRRCADLTSHLFKFFQQEALEDSHPFRAA